MGVILVENLAVLVITALALYKSRCKMICILNIVFLASFILFEYQTRATYQPGDGQAVANYFYYFSFAMFFLCWAAVFFSVFTKLGLVMVGLCFIQSALSFYCAFNGMDLGFLAVPYFEFVYTAHSVFNNGIWIVECIVAWTACQTKD